MPEIVVHHLQYSRSVRILWMLEEMGVEYAITTYQRDANFRAPPELAQVHPLGRAPVVCWDDQVLAESIGLRTVRGTVAARATLEAGFTTIRELGTEGAGFADVALRDGIEAGLIPGPRVLAATRALVATAMR